MPDAVPASPVPARFPVVVFDWDGTLFDSTPAITEAIRRSAADLGLPVPTRAQASHVIGLGLLDAIHQAVPAIERGQIPAFVERYRVHFLKEDASLKAFDGIASLLPELEAAGAVLAVATGKSRAGLNRALAQTGCSRSHCAERCAQRAAKRQPGGGAMRSGGCPSITGRRTCEGLSVRGTDSSRVTRFEGPTMSTPAANRSGVKVRPTRVA